MEARQINQHAQPSGVELPTEPGVSGRINGKTPWEFACDWYGEEEIISAVKRNMVGAFDARPIPQDVHGAEFGKWLTNEYRLAMNKGIEIGMKHPAQPSGEAERQEQTCGCKTPEQSGTIHGYRCSFHREQYLIAQQRLRELEAAIQKHCDQKADDRCWMDDDELYRAAGLTTTSSHDDRVGDKDVMLANCKRFIERRCSGGGWKSYAELEAEIERLREALKDARSEPSISKACDKDEIHADAMRAVEICNAALQPQEPKPAVPEKGGGP